ncbi:hypothetical protein [Halobiforma nitratireducens]|uniref:Uncharacterized protein n=1 Tax=Halobiforma nitratireducens JCM 10879 TaxID=1227454 RepID=M0LK34_9EURY|nr:hypothetical protein [Halobiforma nitratireducens]EMA32370.1 hypothetical protein C446_14699 [Halobiforma nitratireducens JCM 10879]
MLAGSSGLLAVDTLALSNAGAERDVEIDAVADEEAYLGLVETGDSDDGVETSDLLFGDDDKRLPLATFDVANQLPDDIHELTLALEDDTLRFETEAGTVTDDGTRLEVEELRPGTEIGVGIDLNLDCDWSCLDEPITTPIEIVADGETSHMDTVRTLTVISGVLLVCDLRWFGWNKILVVRKRRQLDEHGNAYLALLVELVPCDGDKRRTEATIDASYGSLPTLRLRFPDARIPVDDRGPRSAHPSAPDRNTTESPSASDTRSDEELRDAITKAPTVTVDTELESGPGANGRAKSEPESDGEPESPSSHDDRSRSLVPVLEVDPNGTAPGTAAKSRRTETVDIELESGDDGKSNP